MDCGSVHAKAAAGDGRSRTQAPEGVQGVILPAYWDDVALTCREGDDLAVVLLDGSELVLEGYFSRSKEEEPVLLLQGGLSGEVSAIHVSADGEIVYVERMALGRLEEMFGAAPVDIESVLAQNRTSGGGEPGSAWVILGGLAILVAGAVFLFGDDEEEKAGAELSLLRSIEGMRGAETANAEDARNTLDAYETIYGPLARNELMEAVGKDSVKDFQQFRIQGLLFLVTAYRNAGDEATFVFQDENVVVEIDHAPEDFAEVNERHIWSIHSFNTRNRIDVEMDTDADGTSDIEFSFPLDEYEHGIAAKFDLGGTAGSEPGATAYDGDEDSDPDLVFDRMALDVDSDEGTSSYTLTDRVARVVKGIDEVSLEGSASTTLSLTAKQILILQGGLEEEGIAIRFEGENNDAIDIVGGGVVRAAGSDEFGYAAYTATYRSDSGIVLFDSDITVTGVA